MWIGIAAALLVGMGSMRAQVLINSGEIAGSVHAANGRPVANAAITLRDPDRGISQTVLSDNDGVYRVPLVPPSTYLVEFAASGHVAETFEGVRVNVGEAVRLDATLQSADVAQFKVDVTTT